MADAGFINLSEACMAATIAGTAQFRTVVGAVDATAALTSIHRNCTDENNEEFARPRALIFDGQSGTRRRMATTRVLTNAPMFVDFEFPILAEHADDAGNLLQEHFQASLADFKNSIGLIIEQMEALVGQAGYLFITEIELGSRVLMEHAKAGPADYWLAQFTMHWQG